MRRRPLEDRLPTLRRCADNLWERHAGGTPLHPDEADALTEAMFRLAVRRGTPVDEAVDLLHRAHLVDGDDPRFPYHLGRIAFGADRLAEAQAWLEVALELSPGSHRVGAHLVAVYRARDRREPGGAASRVADRGRARELSAAIRSAGPRWTGIHDIEVLTGLAGEVSERTAAELLPSLTAARDLAGTAGGMGAFAVLAVCWLVRGYPVATVRGLADGLPAHDPLASYLLNRTCQLFELAEAELPGQLAGCLRRDELPGLLVALIHQRRLLWRPMSYPAPGAVRAARWFLADGSASDAAGHVQVLDAGTRELSRRPVTVGAAGPAGDRVDADDARARLAGLRADLTRIDEADGAMVAFAAGPLRAAAAAATTPAELGTVLADHKTLTTALGRLTELAAAAHGVAQRLLDEVGHLGPAELGDDFARDADTVRITLADRIQPGRLRRLLLRVDKAVRAAGGTPDPASEPSPQARTILAALDDAGQPPPAAPTPAPTPAPTDVAAALERAHRAVDEGFAAAVRTLADHPPALATTQLHHLIHGRYADTCHRMGRVDEACRGWHAMLAAGGPDATVLRNLAVVHLCGGVEAHATEMWRHHLEELYLLDVAAGDPRRRAAQRERTHGTLAAAYLPAALRGEQPDAEVSPVAGFLAGRAGVRSATVQLRLERLNRLLSFRTPALRSALDRADLALLPERVRAPFTGLLDGSGPAPDADVSAAVTQAEQQRQGEAVDRLIRLKQRIRSALSQDAAWALGTSAVAVIDNTALVDAIGLDPADDITYRTALARGLSDPERDLPPLDDLRGYARQAAIRHITVEAARQDATTLPERYRAILASWVDSPLSADEAALLDDPQHLYDPRTVAAVVAAYEEPPGVGDGVTAAMEALQTWQVMLPGATGPARHLARLHEVTGGGGRAWEILLDAAGGAVHPSGLLLTVGQAVQLGWRLGRRTELVTELHGLVGRLPTDDGAWSLLRETYLALVREAIAQRRSPTGLIGGLDRCAAALPPPLRAEATARVAAVRRRLLVEVDGGLPPARFTVDGTGTTTQ